jgi:hypothetical protein
MTTEVKLLKKYLKNKYPYLKCKIHMKTARSYVESSDKIIIDIEYKGGLTSEQIIRDIRGIVRGISVGMYGGEMSAWGKINPFIFDIELNEWIDVDTEFIEIK